MVIMFKISNLQKDDRIGDVEYHFAKNNTDDIIWWLSDVSMDDDETAILAMGPMYFSFDKDTVFNVFEDYPDKLTEEQLAEACNTATSYIGLMEIYKNVPKLSTIERIATALGVEPQILFQKPELDKESENKIEKIKEAVMSALEKELVHSLREVI